MKSPSGETPQYLLIKAQLQARIQNGALKSGDKLPSERELCALFNTTRITVRESLAQLESSGVIYRADRRGWFVTPERLWLDPTQNTNFHKLCLEQGREPKTILLDGRLAAVPLDVMRRWRCSRSTKSTCSPDCAMLTGGQSATVKITACPPGFRSCFGMI